MSQCIPAQVKIQKGHHASLVMEGHSKVRIAAAPVRAAYQLFGVKL